MKTTLDVAALCGTIALDGIAPELEVFRFEPKPDIVPIRNGVAIAELDDLWVEDTFALFRPRVVH